MYDQIAPHTCFIIGPPRAGTTMLGHLMAGGSDVLSVSEPFLAHAVLSHWSLHRMFARLTKRLQTCPSRGQLRAAAKPQRPGMHAHTSKARLHPPRETTRRGLMDYMRRLADFHQRPYLVVKETYRTEPRDYTNWCNSDLMDQLAAGDDPIVTIIRHPFDNVASAIRFLKTWKGPCWRVLQPFTPSVPPFRDLNRMVEETARNWSAFVSWVRRHDLPLVRYEDIAHDPHESMATICRLCGVPFEARMLDHRQRRVYAGLGAWEVIHRPARPVSARSIDCGRTELDPEHLETIRELCGEAAASLDYTL